MKLIIKNTYYLLTIYFLIFILVGLSFYYVTKYVISEDFNETLYDRKTDIVNELGKSDSLFVFQRFSGNRITIQKINYNFPIHQINDTLIYDKNENRFLEYRQLVFTTSVKGQYYKIWIRRLLLESEGLAKALLILTIILFLILLVTLFLANQWVSKKIWNPFYKTLEKIKDYKIIQRKSITFPDTDIQEFKELNAGIQQMTERIKKDFDVLKEFTENTSHELQTPLAIIKSQLELLIQADNLTEFQYKILSKSYSAINKLSKLNEALGLLTKIENSQFINSKSMDLNSIIDSKLFNSESLLELKSIEVTKIVNAPFEVKMNPTLADILIENLINNSIKHNVQNGSIIIEINSKELKIINTGNKLELAPSQLFKRFTKSNSLSFGLGLSIVKEICEQNKIKINYEYKDTLHTINLSL